MHRMQAKLSNRVMPYGGNYCPLQLLFVSDLTDLLGPQITYIRWTLALVLFVGSGADVALFASLTGSFPGPCSVSALSGTQQGP